MSTPKAQAGRVRPITIEKRIAELVKQHGSLRAAARELGCSAAYLSRLASGQKSEPSGEVLQGMGLRRVVTYARFEPANSTRQQGG